MKGLEIDSLCRKQSESRLWPAREGAALAPPHALSFQTSDPLPPPSPQNYKRVAKVWMDEYAEALYRRNPHLRDVDEGDVSREVEVSGRP